MDNHELQFNKLGSFINSGVAIQDNPDLNMNLFVYMNILFTGEYT